MKKAPLPVHRVQRVGSNVLLAVKLQLLSLTCIITFVAFATTGFCQNGSEGTVVTNRTPVKAISLFFGPPRNDEAGRKVRELTGVKPYEPGQAQNIEQVRERAVAAIKREGRVIDDAYECAVNIEMTTGKCTLLFNKSGAPHFSVNFDSSGRVTYVGGASGPHGEGSWGRKYPADEQAGEQAGATNRSQSVREQTNQIPAAGRGR